MTILVTGASGFIGSHLLETVASEGHCVRALARKVPSGLQRPNVDWVIGDVRDPNCLDNACRDVTHLFHLAARVTDWGTWRDFRSTTVEGTRNVIRSATAAGVHRLIHFSSVAVYDDRYSARHHIICENAPRGARGDRSHGNYARSKVAAEQLVWESSAKGHIEAVVLRPALVYGPRDRVTLPRLVDYLSSSSAAWPGRGSPIIDPIFVSDVVECAVLASRSEVSPGKAYNVAPTQEINVREFWTAICVELDLAVPRFALPRNLLWLAACLSEAAYSIARSPVPPPITRAGLALFAQDRHHIPRRAIEELGWQPRIGLEEGVRRTIQTLASHVQA